MTWYLIGAWVTAIATFIGVWAAAISSFGMLGIALGWVPAAAAALLACFLWPMAVVAAGAIGALALAVN